LARREVKMTRRVRKTRGREKRTRENKKNPRGKKPSQLLRTQYSEDKKPLRHPGLEFWIIIRPQWRVLDLF